MMLCDRDRVYICHIEVITSADLFAFFFVEVIYHHHERGLHGKDGRIFRGCPGRWIWLPVFPP
jgi:hypothetical protein